MQATATDTGGTGKAAKLSQTASSTDSTEPAKPNNLAKPATVASRTGDIITTLVMLVALLGLTRRISLGYYCSACQLPTASCNFLQLSHTIAGNSPTTSAAQASPVAMQRPGIEIS